MMLFVWIVLSVGLAAESGDSVVDRHGVHPSEGVVAPVPPQPEVPDGVDPNVAGLRGDRRMKSVGYVEWVPSVKVAGYLLEWSTNPNGPWYPVTDEPFVGREILLRGMPSAEPVLVRIRAIFKNGAMGPCAGPISIPPFAD